MKASHVALLFGLTAAGVEAAPRKPDKAAVQAVCESGSNIHGTPFAQMEKIGKEVSFENLARILQDSKLVSCWEQAVLIMGVQGDVRAVKPLIKFMQSTGPLEFDEPSDKSNPFKKIGGFFNRIFHHEKTGAKENHFAAPAAEDRHFDNN